MLQGTHLSLNINNNEILKDINVSIGHGELVGLIGPNGAGKTSLLRILANLQQPSTGNVTLNAMNFSQFSRKQLAQTLGYLEQGAPAYWPLIVRRLVELGRLPYLNPFEKMSGDDRHIVDEAMKLAEVQHLSDRVVNTLSGGERLRVLIARMFATQPTMILADEPIASLDPYHQMHTMELFRDHCDRDGGAVVVLHDLNTAARYCHRLVLMNRGSIVIDGTPEQVLVPDILAEVYGIEVELLPHTSSVTVLPKNRVTGSETN